MMFNVSNVFGALWNICLNACTCSDLLCARIFENSMHSLAHECLALDLISDAHSFNRTVRVV